MAVNKLTNCFEKFTACAAESICMNETLSTIRHGKPSIKDDKHRFKDTPPDFSKDKDGIDKNEYDRKDHSPTIDSKDRKLSDDNDFLNDDSITTDKKNQQTVVDYLDKQLADLKDKNDKTINKYLIYNQYTVDSIDDLYTRLFLKYLMIDYGYLNFSDRIHDME